MINLYAYSAFASAALCVIIGLLAMIFGCYNGCNPYKILLISSWAIPVLFSFFAALIIIKFESKYVRLSNYIIVSGSLLTIGFGIYGLFADSGDAFIYIICLLIGIAIGLPVYSLYYQKRKLEN